MNASEDALRQDGRFNWALVLGAVGALQVASLIPLVGIDSDAAANFTKGLHPPPSLDAFLGIGGRIFSPFGLSVSLLFWCRAVALFVSGGKPYAERGSINRISFLVYLGLSALQGFGVVLYLKSLYMHPTLGAMVPDPGLRFRVVGILSILAAQSIVWAPASWISGRRVVQGPLLLFVIEIVYRTADWGYRTALEGAQDGFSFSDAAPLICTVAAVAVLLFGGALRFPNRLPVRPASRLTVYTAADAAALAVLVGTFSLPQESIAKLLSGLLSLFVEIPTTPFVFLLLLTLPFSAKGLLVWRKRAGAVSARPGLFILPVLFLLTVGTSAALGFREGGGFVRMFGPGPFEGNQQAQIALRSQHSSPADLERIHRRLDALKIVHSVSSSKDMEILTLEGVSSLGKDFLDVFARGSLRFSLVSADQSAISPNRLSLDSEQEEALALKIVREADSSTGRFNSLYEGPNEESLAPILSALKALPDADGMIQCKEAFEGGRTCRVVLVEKEVAIDNRHIKNVLRTKDYDGRSALKLNFTDEGKERFRIATGENLRRQMALTVDGDIYSTPVIMDEIRGGSAQLTLPNDPRSSAEASERAAAVLEAVLSFAPLDEPWEASGQL